MDYSDGRGSPANLQPVDSPEYSGAQARADLSTEANLTGMRRLEADMGLPSGYLAIHERGTGQPQAHFSQQDRPAPAPYYEQAEPRPNPRAGTVPSEMAPRDQSYPVPPPSQNVDRSQYRPVPRGAQIRYADQTYDQSYQDQGYMSPRDYQEQQRWIDQQRMQDRNQYIDQQRYIDQRRMDSRRINEQLMYDSQRQIDRGYYQQQRQPGYRQEWWEESQYPSNVGQRWTPSRNPQLDARRQQWWDQSRYPSDQRYYPSNNPDLDQRRQQWWDQSRNPSDQRYNPGRNPELDWYRQRWWQNSQTPPYSYDRTVPTQEPVEIDRGPRYYPGDQQTQYFATVINSYLGHSINEYDRTVPVRLGCARAVSLVLERTYGLPIREQSCERLEDTIKSYGWEQVDPRNIQPNDVIIGQRAPGMKGHSAIYLGNDQIFNNNSNSGVMQIESAGKFRSNEFVSVRVYRKTR